MMLAITKGLIYTFFSGGGVLESGVEPRVRRVHNRGQVSANRFHGQPADFGVDDRSGGVEPLLLHRGDGRRELVHLGGNVGLELQQALLLFRTDIRRLCRFSDAGSDDPSTRSGGRRLKSAKARNRGKWGTVGAAGSMGI
jgi:hypothetical protein